MNHDLNNYIYTQSGTDITLRWKKIYGYVPASQMPKYQKKWKAFKDQFVKTIDDIEIEPVPGVIEWKKRQKYL